MYHNLLKGEIKEISLSHSGVFDISSFALIVLQLAFIVAWGLAIFTQLLSTQTRIFRVSVKVCRSRPIFSSSTSASSPTAYFACALRATAHTALQQRHMSNKLKTVVEKAGSIVPIRRFEIHKLEAARAGSTTNVVD